MARFLRHLIVTTLSWFVLAAVTDAQPSPAVARQFNFTVFSAQPIGNLSYVPQADAAPVALTFYPTARSPRYAYRGAPQLEFLDRKSGEVLATVSVPPKLATVLFILSAVEPAAGGTARYRVEIVDDGPSKHAPGTLLILNFSGLELAGIINRRHVALQPGPNAPIRVEGSAAVDLRTPFRGRSYQAYAETLPLDGSDRSLLLLLPPYRTGSLEVQSRVLLDAAVPAASVKQR